MSKTKSNQHFSNDWGGAPETPPLAEEILATDGWWRRFGLSRDVSPNRFPVLLRMANPTHGSMGVAYIGVTRFIKEMKKGKRRGRRRSRRRRRRSRRSCSSRRKTRSWEEAWGPFRQELEGRVRVLRSEYKGSEELAPCLGASIALPETWVLFLASTWLFTAAYNSAPGTLTPPSGLWRYCIHMVHIYTCKAHT